MMHNETFATYGEAVFAVERWSEEARRDGRALGSLLAVIDATKQPTSVAMLAPRPFWVLNAKRFSKNAEQLKQAVKRAPAAGLFVWTASPHMVQLGPIDALAETIRQIRMSKGDA